jgi:hypothetical protein
MSKKRIQAKLPEYLLQLLPEKEINSEIVEEEINLLYEKHKPFLEMSKQEDLKNRGSSFYISEETHNKFKELLDSELYRSNAGLITAILKRQLTLKPTKSELNYLNNMKQPISYELLNKIKKEAEKKLAPKLKPKEKEKEKREKPKVIQESTLLELKKKIKTTKLTPETAKLAAELYGDFQDVRISTANKLRFMLKNKADIEEEVSDKDLKDRMITLLKNKEIDRETYNNYEIYFDLFEETKEFEKLCKRIMQKGIKTHPVYIKFLLKIRGIGPVFSANLIKEFGDCSQYETVSKLWAHTGNHVVNGKAPRRRKGKKINFDPDLRQLTWKISRNLMMQNKGFYRKEYEREVKKQRKKTYEPGILHKKYKNSYEPAATKLSKNHAKNRALRKIRKIFLDHYWHVARESAGLSAEKNYVKGVLEHEHITTWNEAVQQENSLLK